MGTERFEDKIKRQLLDREIAPSAGSWDKLSAKLDASQEKKRPFAFWMGIAASIIGGILILSLVFNNSTLSNSPEIVDAPKEDLKIEKTPVKSSKEIFTEIKKEAERVAASEGKQESITSKKDKVDPLINQVRSKNREEIAVLDNKALLKEQKINTSLEAASDNLLDLTLNNALASVLTQTDNGQEVTDAEINKLLAEAASKISQERYKKDFALGKVNAQDLLQDVEFEMDNSFRDKIFEILKEGYSKARTAVANRNY
ncbi:hypothetical protein BC962_1127 [Gillisia mitskevichiae]|uniref:Uncharacterized protein n=1 Tax=Gillisia mitskevichiae TaxID=270921 RepID=A0A495Q048_9FLAO|nr:hypothetical protein [Gillisia mitskevichiae]RKS56148.1 hypothetical protein BC962_1127 [Gillisia mitskevichiae]